MSWPPCLWFFCFQAEDGIRDLTVTGVQTCALPIFGVLGIRDGATLTHDERKALAAAAGLIAIAVRNVHLFLETKEHSLRDGLTNCFNRTQDRKSTRLNSSHSQISYAVFCLKKQKTI